MKSLILIWMFFVLNAAVPIDDLDEMLAAGNESIPILYPTRRILRGTEVGETRPYMVYLRPAAHVERKLMESHWLCGGAIIHERYVLTSAACIEDAKHFYVISGTHTWVPPEVTDNECINNGAKKAVWKCVPKSYFFDGDDFDNIRWMVGDIAIVKVEDDFNFERRIRGCDFIPKKVEYNNHSAQLERPATLASVAGWGTTEKFVDINGIGLPVDDAQEDTEVHHEHHNHHNHPETIEDVTKALRSAANSVQLLETDVMVISKKSCKKRWDERYHFIINDEMICTKDSADDEPMSAACADREVSCKGLELSEEDYYDENEDATDAPPQRRMIIDPRELQVHTAAHRDARRKNRMKLGGFCEAKVACSSAGLYSVVHGYELKKKTRTIDMVIQRRWGKLARNLRPELALCAYTACEQFRNDHGGPLVVGRGRSSVVIGIMSACHTKEIDMKCYGPFLFTSVYKYRSLISCAIDKNTESTCRKLLNSAKTHMKETEFNWSESHPSLRIDNEDKNIARNFDVPSLSKEVHEPRPTQPPPPPTTKAPKTTKKRPPPSTAAPPVDSGEQEFRHNEKKRPPKPKAFDTVVDHARPSKLVELDVMNSNNQNNPENKPNQMPSWLTDKQPPDLGQARAKEGLDDSGEFSSIKKVIMRRFFNNMYAEK